MTGCVTFSVFACFNPDISEWPNCRRWTLFRLLEIPGFFYFRFTINRCQCFSVIAQTDFDLLIFLPLKLVHNYVCCTSKLMPLLSHTYLCQSNRWHVVCVTICCAQTSEIIECDVVFLSAARSSVLSFVLPSANSECISISPNKLLLGKSRSSWLQCVKFSTITDFRTVSSIFSNYKCIL